LINAIFSNTDWILKLFYTKVADKVEFVIIFTKILEMLPPYQFTLGFGLVAVCASSRFDYGSMSWEPGTPFGNAEYY